jgi:hypothetical protein
MHIVKNAFRQIQNQTRHPWYDTSCQVMCLHNGVAIALGERRGPQTPSSRLDDILDDMWMIHPLDPSSRPRITFFNR